MYVRLIYEENNNILISFSQSNQVKAKIFKNAQIENAINNLRERVLQNFFLFFSKHPLCYKNNQLVFQKKLLINYLLILASKKSDVEIHV